MFKTKNAETLFSVIRWINGTHTSLKVSALLLTMENVSVNTHHCKAMATRVTLEAFIHIDKIYVANTCAIRYVKMKKKIADPNIKINQENCPSTSLLIVSCC